jgi:hypothetical protein
LPPITTARVAGLAAAALLPFVPAHAAPPTVEPGTLTPGFTFEAYLDTDTPVGAGFVDNDSVLYYIEEKTANLLCPAASCKSYLIFFDPATVGLGVQATLTFEAPIVRTFSGIVGLTASSLPYGANGYTYFPAVFTGPEDPGLEFEDQFSVIGNQLTIDFVAADPGDHLRVLVAVPEAGTAAMLAAGLLTLGAAGARRRRGTRA